MTGSRLLAVLGVLAFAAFACQRACSPFLLIERERGAAQAIAVETGLDALDVMALRELLGADLPQDELRARSRSFAAERGRLGIELAVLAVAGEAALAERIFAESGGNAARAHELLRPRREAVLAVRFSAVRERFASRMR